MQPSGDHARILIVDDNVQNLKLARLALSGDGYEIQTAGDAEEAATAISAFEPHVILMDLQLPGMSGLELTRLLRAEPRTKEIAIVAVTAFAMTGDRETALAAGCNEYVTKPIDIDRLRDVVATQLARVKP